MPSKLVLQLLIWTLVAALDLAMSRAAMPSGGLGWAVYEAVSLGALGLLVSSALLATYRRWPARGVRAWAVVLAGTSAGAAVWYVALDALDRASGNPYAVTLAEGLFGRGMLVFFILLAWHAAVVALDASGRAARAERLAQEAQLQALRYQLNPHFLFNALNSATALVDEDPARAQAMLTLLSSLLRRTLAENAAAETTLAEELELISRYMEIQRIRFEDKLQVEVEVADAARRCAVPPLSLHALVENAVKHGLRTSSTLPVTIRLFASYDGDALRIAVENSGTIAPRGAGVGLKNVGERLSALYPGRHSLSLAEHDGAVRAVMEIRSPRVLA